LRLATNIQLNQVFNQTLLYMYSDQLQSTKGKGNKRNKPDHDSSFDEIHNSFQRSKITPRTPTKLQESAPEQTLSMEEIRAMLEDFRKDFKEDMAQLKLEIKGEVTEIKGDIKEMKAEIRKNSDEMKCIKEQIIRMKEEWREEKCELLYKIQQSEQRIEKLEKDKIRNNLVITGISMDVNDEAKLKQAAVNLFREEFKEEVKIRRAFKIGQAKCIVELEEWSDKLKILKTKGGLRGKDIFIDAELTRNEREIQKKIRDQARNEKGKGSNVKVGYQKLIVDGKVMKWNLTEGKLVENISNSKN
jgi:hypothetical protein